MKELEELNLNIIKWYNFKNTDKILCCGNFNKYIIDYFSKIFNTVTVIENNVNKFANISSINDKFDYIFLLDIFEDNVSDEEIIKEINLNQNLLKEDGSILLVTNNIMGVKNIIKEISKGFTKDRLVDLIEKSDIKYYKFYYAFSTIKDVNFIISDDYKTSFSDIRRNISFSDEKNNIGILENKFLYNVLKNNINNFKYFSNVFFIELNNSNNFSNINAVYYNNLRKNNQRLITKIYDYYAIKETCNEESIEHLEKIKNNIDILKKCKIKTLDSYGETFIKSKILYQVEKFDDKIRDLFKRNDEKYKELINIFKNEVLLKLEISNDDNNIFNNYNIDIPKKICEKLTFIKYGLWDLTFQNVFVYHNDFFVYDQEWYKENIPVEFVIYRSINLMEDLTDEDKNKMYEQLELSEFLEYFRNLESILQKELTNFSLIYSHLNTIVEDNPLEGLEEKYEEKYNEKYNRLIKNYEFQNKLIKSKELICNSLKNEYKDYYSIKRNLEIEKSKNKELQEMINGNSFQKSLSINRKSKFFSPIYINCKKVIGGVKKIVIKGVRIPIKALYLIAPKKTRRKIKNKIQYSRRLSKIARIPMYSEYKNLMLVSTQNNNVRQVYSQTNLNKSIGIHLHLYYEDLAEEFYNYLSNIPYSFDLYISIRKDACIWKIKRIFKKLMNLNYLEVIKSENCGRDFGPMFVLFSKKLKKYDYIMHIHSKKSLRIGNEQKEWRQYLLNNILGSQDRIMKCFYLMEHYNIGMVYPDTHNSVPYWAHTWLNEASLARDICNKLNIDFNDDYLEFSAGSMFWAKKDAIEPLLDLNLTWEDFGKEQKQTGGTLEYVFERIFGLVTKNRGYDLAIYNENKDVFLLNKGEKNLTPYFLKNEKSCLKDLLNYDIISFDIFDTLITRKIYNPDDLFLIMEKRIKKSGINIENFKKLRKDAELNVRVKKNFEKDCSIDEIYDEFLEITNLSKENVEIIKNIEFKTELEFCIPRKDSLKIYNELLNASKKIVLISDMYLTKDMLNKILNNCGYYNYFELLVSSDIGYRKDNGTMWNYFYKKYSSLKTIHVGDNEEADMHKPLDLGKNICHFMQGKKLYYISNYNVNKKFNLDESIVFGNIINKGLFNSPFSMYNYGKESIIKDEFSYGYSILGPIIFEYFRWLINSIINSNKKEVLLFVSREGWYLQKIYKHILSKLNNEKLNSIENHYFYISRRAITVAEIEKIEDIYEIMKKEFKGTLRELMYYRLGYKIDTMEDILIELPTDYELVKRIIRENYEKIIKNVQYEKENYLIYIKNTLGDYTDKNLNFIDLGYSGTAQYYLSSLINKKIDGKYFTISKNIKPLSIGCKVESCYNDNIYDISEIDKNPLYNYSILIEAFLTAPQGQLQYFEREDDNVIPVFNYDNNLDKVDSLEKIYNGIIEYIDDLFIAFDKDEILNMNIDKKLFLKLYECFVHDSRYMNKDMKRIFNIDDYYCSNGIINGVDIWKNI